MDSLTSAPNSVPHKAQSNEGNDQKINGNQSKWKLVWCLLKGAYVDRIRSDSISLLWMKNKKEIILSCKGIKYDKVTVLLHAPFKVNQFIFRKQKFGIVRIIHIFHFYSYLLLCWCCIQLHITTNMLLLWFDFTLIIIPSSRNINGTRSLLNTLSLYI